MVFLRDLYQVRVEVDDTLECSEVLIRATTLENGIKIADYLSKYKEQYFFQLPIKQEDSVFLLEKEAIIFAEVCQKELTIVTLEGKWCTKMALSHLLAELPEDQFLQISKSSIVNLQKIHKLELSFSGNLTAFLTNGIKVQVARRYVKELKKRLGI